MLFYKYIYIFYNIVNIFDMIPHHYKELGWNATNCASSNCCCYSNNTLINLEKNKLLACCLSLPNKECGCGLNKSYFLNYDFDHCINKCLEKNECKSVNFNKLSKECWLYQEYSQKKIFENNYISAIIK